MKNRKQKLLVAAVTMLVAGAAYADVVYHELFTVETAGVNDTMSEHGWEAHEGTGGAVWTYPSISSTGGTAWDGGPVNSSPLNSTDGDGGYFYGYAHTDLASFFHTSEYSFDMADSENYIFSMRHTNSRADNTRATIKIDGSWYISDAVALAANAGWGTAAMWEVDADTATWYALNFTSGTTMTIGSSVALPSTGTADSFGFYVDGAAASSIRYDNYMIEGVPEPATLGLVSVAFGWMIFLRRRLV